MPAVPILLAQCATALEDCDLPRTLPWYFGLAIAVAWLGAVVGVVLLVRRRLVTRRRERKGPRRGAIEARKGTDVDLW